MSANKMSHNKISTFIIGAVHSGGGKTTVTLALLRALIRRGLRVQPFKCGPDYIDPTFHQRACHGRSINLDTWMMHPEGVRNAWERHVIGADAAVIEGVMGLFDGHGTGSLSGSTADCARLLGVPVVLVVDAKGMAGSIAPLVAGYHQFHPEVKLCGVIANRVGSERHAELLAEALNVANLPPLLGALPENPEWELPERHLGLVPFLENEKSEAWFDRLAAAAEKYFDLDRLLKVAERPRTIASLWPPVSSGRGRIAVAYDRAFHFYYEENLERLRTAGFEITLFSPLTDPDLPKAVDMLYIGGGFPECFAAELAANTALRKTIRDFAEAGGAIYAECGGFMYLCRELIDAAGVAHPMCQVLAAAAEMRPKLQALGYREVNFLADTLLAPRGTPARGHEFHWSDIGFEQSYPPLFQVRSSRGDTWETGVVWQNVRASYIHLHFASNPTLLRRKESPS